MEVNMSYCENGHYYDGNKYPDGCPHCRQGLSSSMASVDVGDTLKTVSMSPQIPATQGGNITATNEKSTPARTSTPLSSMNLSGADEKTVPMNDTKTERHYPGIIGVDPVVGWLVILKGSDKGRSYVLRAQQNFIGRNNDMDIVLNGDNSVSRDKHAIITYEPRSRKFFVSPGESKALFYVDNNVVLTPVEITDRQIISVGKTELVLVAFCNENFAWEDLDEEKDGEQL